MTVSVSKIANECIAVRLRLINRAVTNIYDDALRPFGLKVSQMNILVVVSLRKTVRPSEIGEVLQIDRSTLSRNIERMKSRGWLENIEDEDARAQPVRLTKTGRDLLKEVSPAWEEAQAQATELMGEEFIASVRDAARQVSQLS